MSEVILEITGVGSVRRFTGEDLPVSLGGHVNSDVPLRGAAGELQLGMLDDAWFVQAGRDSEVQLNGVALRGTQKVAAGDIVEIEHTTLRFSGDSGVLRVRVEQEQAAAPLALDAGKEQADDEAIAVAPIQFRRQKEAAEETGRRYSRSQIAIGVAFFVLAVLGWFAFTAKSVQFVFAGQPQAVELPSTLFKLRLGERFLLRTGGHRVTAELDGYYPLDTELEVMSGANQRIELPFERLPGLVSISSEPAAGATVYLDNRRIGEPPLDDYEIPEGEHELRFELDRHFPVTVEIDVRGGHQRQRVSVELQQTGHR